MIGKEGEFASSQKDRKSWCAPYPTLYADPTWRRDHFFVNVFNLERKQDLASL